MFASGAGESRGVCSAGRAGAVDRHSLRSPHRRRRPRPHGPRRHRCPHRRPRRASGSAGARPTSGARCSARRHFATRSPRVCAAFSARVGGRWRARRRLQSIICNAGAYTGSSGAARTRSRLVLIWQHALGARQRGGLRVSEKIYALYSVCGARPDRVPAAEGGRGPHVYLRASLPLACACAWTCNAPRPALLARGRAAVGFH